MMHGRVLFFIGSALFYLGIPMLSFVLLSLCSKKFWIGILLCVFFCLFAVITVDGTMNDIFLASKHYLPSHTLWIGCIGSLGLIAICVSVGAYISLLIARFFPSRYVTERPGHYFDFVSTYVWHFFEVTRLIQVGTTFGLEKPVVRPTSWLGGIPLFVFKLLSLAISFVLLAKIWVAAVEMYQAMYQSMWAG